MKKSYIWVLVVDSLIVLLLVSACSRSVPAPAPSTPPATSSAPAMSPASKSTPSSAAPSPTATAPGATTVGQLADAGKTVYASRCAKCHGDRGQGVGAPPVIGASANLQKFNNAQALLEYINIAMPMDAPGGLSRQEYSQVLSFLLVENGFTPATTVFDAGNLSRLTLKK